MSDTPSLTMKDLDPNLQPREKADKYGYHTLSKSELLALILRVGVPGTPIINITSKLLEDNEGSLHNLMRRNVKEIMKTPGMGPVKAGQVMAILELIKRYGEEENNPDRMVIRDSKCIYENMRFQIGNLNKEEVWLLTLNRGNRIIGRHRLTSGSSTASVFDLKAALKKAVLDEASSLILCHNHPSGNRMPSPQDDQITRSMKTAAAAMEFRLLDHVIVTCEGFYSYADEGRL